MTIKKDLGFKEGDEFNLTKAVDNFLSTQEDKVKQREYFYMSEAGKCKKAIYNDFKNPKAFKSDAKTKRVFSNGDYVHMRFQKLFAEMGILIGAELEMNNDLIHGRCDAIITDGEKNYIVDIKSISQWSFQKLVNADESHVIQLLLYMYYFNIPNGILFYECKDNQVIREFYINMTPENKIKIEKIIEDLKTLKESIDKNEEPACEFSEDKCKYCEYKKSCNSYMEKELKKVQEYVG